MKLVSSTEIPQRVEALLAVAGGVVVVTSGDDGSFLAGYDVDLALRWRHRLEQKALALGAAHGEYWLLDAKGLQAFDASGALGVRLTGGAHPEMRAWYLISKRLSVSGDAVLACYWDMPRSGIGVGYVVSLAEVTRACTLRVRRSIWMTPPRPPWPASNSDSS